MEGMDLAIELLAKVSSTALHDVAVAVVGCMTVSLPLLHGLGVCVGQTAEIANTAHVRIDQRMAYAVLVKKSLESHRYVSAVVVLNAPTSG